MPVRLDYTFVNMMRHVSGPSSAIKPVDRGWWRPKLIAGAALVTDQAYDGDELCQAGEAVGAEAFALLDKVVAQISLAVDLIAFGPTLLQQLSFSDILMSRRAQ